MRRRYTGPGRLRAVKIYTRAGDGGETGLQGGRRVAKSDARIMAYGAIDEANCALGLAACDLDAGSRLAGVAARLQSELFSVGADLSNPDPGSASAVRMGAADVARLERDIDALDAQLEPLSSFVLPGGSRPAAALHLARAAVRRAETHIASIEGHVGPHCLPYVNRLSDLLFTMARAANMRAGVADVPWRPKDTL